MNNFIRDLEILFNDTCAVFATLHMYILQYDAARYMYIQVEHPKHIVRGEQIGVRVTVFNYWYDDDYLEVRPH